MSFIFYKKLIKSYKIFKNVKGLNNLKYTSIVIIGDKNGGLGIGKSFNFNQNVSIFKALNKAKNNFIKIPIFNETLPTPAAGKFCNTTIKIFPVKNRFNFSAGGILRPILKISGITRVTSKISGSRNIWNILNCIYNIFKNIKILYNLNK